MSSAIQTAEGIVALFNASDDTIDMVQTLLTKSGGEQTLIWCHFADVKKGSSISGNTWTSTTRRL
jgi:hypothetical protein